MKKFTIQPMDLLLDKQDICEWDDIYTGTPEYESIERFVLENHLLKDLSEVIETQHQTLPIDYREIKNAFVIKSEENILGFLLCYAYDIADYSSALYIQYIVLNPKFQKQGYGTEILTEFFTNLPKYIGFTPVDVHALIHINNKESLSLFKKFGFTFIGKSRSYLRADNDTYTINNILNQKTFE